jgi:hypothetical protein
VLGDQKVTLAAGEVKANTSDGLFGAGIFKSLSPVPIVRVQFTGAAGAINVLVLQVRGKSLASMPANAVFEQ